MNTEDTAWQHPWVRISLLIRSILGTQWDAATWAQIRLEVPKALVLKAKIQRAGWFNWRPTRSGMLRGRILTAASREGRNDGHH